MTELHVAFSREGKKKDYVQHQLAGQAHTVSTMLSDKEDACGVVYVCGDAKHMAQVSLDIAAQSLRLASKSSVGAALSKLQYARQYNYTMSVTLSLVARKYTQQSLEQNEADFAACSLLKHPKASCVNMCAHVCRTWHKLL